MKLVSETTALYLINTNGPSATQGLPTGAERGSLTLDKFSVLYYCRSLRGGAKRQGFFPLHS